MWNKKVGIATIYRSNSNFSLQIKANTWLEIVSSQVSFLAKVRECKITRWNNHSVDIISCTGGKTAGIRAYLKERKVSVDETAAFGDGENDIDMLKFVQTGIAMGNAHDEVKNTLTL